MVYLNATDMRSGHRFEFSQDQFDHLCSDLNRVPLARAVAASMALPLVLSPVALWNHRDRCPVPVRPVDLPGVLARGSFVHLIDGGLSDNTVIRAALDHLSTQGSLRRSGRTGAFRGARKRIFIIVDAQVDPAHLDDDSPDTPGLWQQLRSAIDVPIDRYSESSLAQLQRSIADWKGAQAPQDIAPTLAGVDTPAVAFHVVTLKLAAALSHDADAVRRIPTGLHVTPEQFETIRRFVRDELDASPAWYALLADLHCDASPPERVALEADGF